MKFNFSQFRQVIYFFLILLFLTAVFSTYYFRVVAAKESEINNRAFRTLNKINENIVEKKNILINNINNFKKNFHDESLVNTQTQLDNFLKQYQINKEIIVELDSNKSVSAPAFFGEDFLISLDSVEINKKEHKSIKFKIEIEDLVKPFLTTEVFDHFIIYKNKQNIYQDLPGDCDFDSLVKRSDPFITIQNEAYKTYSYQEGKNGIILFGLKKKSRYNEERLGISTFSIFILSLLMIVVSLLFPFIKLATISKLERVKASTILSAWSILILGGSLIVLLLLSSYTIYTINKAKVVSNLHSISHNIKGNLLDELKKIDQQLDHYTSNLIRHENQNYKVLKAHKDSILPSDQCIYNFINIFSVDTSGHQQFKFSRKKGESPEIPVSHRDYFKNARNGNTWPIFHNADTIQLFLESNYSHIDGVSQAVISQAAPARLQEKGIAVVALSVELNALYHPIMPLGYGFCIIDQQGKVLFHNNKEKNLQENFLEECSKMNVIRSAMNKQVSLQLSTRYGGKNCEISIVPLQDMPLFLITYYDEGFGTMINSEVLLLSFIFICIIFGFCFFHVFLQQVLKLRYKKLKQPAIDFEWVIPVREKGIIYSAGIFFQLLIIYHLTKYSNALLADPEPSIYALLGLQVLFCALTFLGIYNLLASSEHGQIKHRNLAFNGITILLILALAYFIHVNDSSLFISVLILLAILGCMLWKHKNILYKVISVSLLCICLGLTDNLSAFNSYPLSVVFMTILIGLILFVSNRIEKAEVLSRLFPVNLIPVKNWAGNRYKWVFIVLLLLWLGITSILPTFYSYCLALNLKEKFATQLVQAELIHHKRRVATQKKADKANFKDRYYPLKDDSVYNFYLSNDLRICRKNCFADKTGKISCNNCNKEFTYHPPKPEFKSSLYFLSKLPVYNFFTENSFPLIIARLNESDTSRQVPGSILWEYSKQDKAGNYSMHTYFKSNKNYHQTLDCVASDLSYFKLQGISFLTIILFVLFILLILKFFVEKVFYMEKFNAGKFDVDVLNELNERLIVITPPNCNTPQFLKEKFKREVAILDIPEIDQDSWNVKTLAERPGNISDTGLLLIDHWEYGIKNIAISKFKANLLKTLLAACENKRLVLISSLHPDQILETYMKMAEVQADKRDEWVQIYEEYVHIFKYFLKTYLPLQQNVLLNQHSEPSCDTQADKEVPQEIKNLIEEECNHGTFMMDLKSRLLHYCRQHDAGYPDEEKVILKIQEYASNYYLFIWNSLSEEEKYIIYDFAQDGIINLKNSDGICILLSKGLLVMNRGLRLMNRSFKNFILTEVNKNEVLMIEKLQSKAGTSGRMGRSILLTAVFFLGIFILFTQKETGNKLIALIASFATSLQLMLNLFGSLNASKKKS